MERNQVRKYDKKTLVYMFITAICLLACVFLMVKLIVFDARTVPLHDPHSIEAGHSDKTPGTSGGNGDSELHISGEQFALAIEDGLAGILPIKDVRTSFNNDYTASFSGVASKHDIERLIENGGIDAPPLIKIAIGLLPEEVTLSAVLGIELKTGRLNAPLQSLKISGIDIDTGFLPEHSENAINDALNGFVDEGGAIQSLEIINGVMVLQTNQ